MLVNKLTNVNKWHHTVKCYRCFDSSNEEIICCTDEVRRRQEKGKTANLSVKQTNKKAKITHFKAMYITFLTKYIL